MTSLPRPLATAAAAAALLAALIASPHPARADIGLGLFVGEPTGIAVKLDLERNTALELLGGWGHYRGRNAYGHVTFLVTPFAAKGRSVIIPFRIGIGGAVYDVGDLGVAARAPFQLAFMFRTAPLELYGELALVLRIVPDADLDLDGGVGFRIYF